MLDSYKEAARIYRVLRGPELKRNRKVSIAAIRRVLERLNNNPIESMTLTERAKLDPLPRAIITYTNIKYMSKDELFVLSDLAKYLNGEVG